MGQALDIGAMRQVIEAYDARQEMLANGDQALQAQESTKAENAAILQSQEAQIFAYRQHLEELQSELALLRGEIVVEDRKQELPWGMMVQLNWNTQDVVGQVAGWLSGWSRVRDDLFQPANLRKMLQLHSKRLFLLHDRLIGRQTGRAS